jgi:archaellin
MALIQGDVIGGSAGFYPKEIEQSLRFNDDDSAYLSWTPASAGNRKTMTFSTWFKRGATNSGYTTIFTAGNNSPSARTEYGLYGDKLHLGLNPTGATWNYVTTNAVIRDHSAWYHLVVAIDMTQATSTNRVKCWVNGELQTFSAYSVPSQNTDLPFNNTVPHYVGSYLAGAQPYDGYLAETHFIDGTAYDATAFGEFKNGVWVAKEFAGTYGTNGFYLPFRNDYTVEGFSAVTYKGNGSTQYIGGVGFEPDLIWIKERNGGSDHVLFDSVRGVTKRLRSNKTNAEDTVSNSITSFEPDGFVTGADASQNESSAFNYVAWCWDAGTGSPVSNTDGSITSTVKANPDRGFSIVSYTGTGSAGTLGHGLSSAPEMIIVKSRTSGTANWITYSESLGNNKIMLLNLTDAVATSSTCWNNTSPTSSLFTVGTHVQTNNSGDNFIAYCFHSVSGYSKMGSWTGTGSSLSVTTGFKPAFVLLKNTSDGTTSWIIFDGTRNTSDPRDLRLDPNSSDAESTFSNAMDFDADGFTINSSGLSQSGDTYIYMAFADTREAAFWLDDSGNNNDWENNGLTESDISLDSPTNNFATWNPLYDFTGSTFQEGNLKTGTTSAGLYGYTTSTIAPSSGKWYCELYCTSSTTSDKVGLGKTTVVLNGTSSTGIINYHRDGGYIQVDGSTQATGSTFGAGDIVGIAADLDSGSATFYKNGVSQGSASFTAVGDYFIGIMQDGRNSLSSNWSANFGQDSSFAGVKTPQGYTDANGIGDFYYAPPAGYLALCTANLPEPAIGPNSATNSDEHFGTALWAGDNDEVVTHGQAFTPDFVWVKARNSATWWHVLSDRVRGFNNLLSTNSTAAENPASPAGWISSIDDTQYNLVGGSNGAPSDDGNFDRTGVTYVGWNWKANGSGVSNTDGSITSTVSANVDAGFSIVSYTGTGSAATVGHGLNQTPDMMIVKNRNDGTRSWIVYHKDNTSAPETDFLRLDATNATADYPVWNDTAPTSSVFSVGDASTNGSGNGIITYCFHSVEGFSKFGSYTGNKAVDGPFVYLGFKPAFIMIKSVQYVDNWFVFDSARDDDNIVTATLYPNSSSAETYQSGSSFNPVDFLSNGFKIRGDNGAINDTGAQFIYMAFAENPFKYSNAR